MKRICKRIPQQGSANVGLKQRAFREELCILLFISNHPLAFCVITFELIEVQTYSATQNDCLNLRLVKEIWVDGKKLARNGQKTAILAGRLGSYW